MAKENKNNKKINNQNKENNDQIATKHGKSEQSSEHKNINNKNSR